MAQIPPDNQVRPPAGPGALANRQDLTGKQPLRIPTGLPYGAAGQLRTQEQAIPMPQGQGLPAASPQGPPQGPQGAAGAPQPEDPRAILAAVSGHPTDFPNMPLATSQPQTLGDLLGAMASSPNAPPDVVALAELARRMQV